MPQDDVEARLRIALTTTIVDEYSLFVAGAHGTPPSGRAVAAQLAFRLRHLFEGQWDVDVEYNSRPTLGERRVRSRSLQLPVTTDLVIHRRGRSGRDNNMLLLVLMIQRSSHFEGEMQRLSSLIKAHDYQHAALLNLNLAYAAADDEPPAVVLPTWHWASSGTKDSDAYSKNLALSLCRRGNRQYSVMSGDDRENDSHRGIQLEMFPEVAEPRRVEILQQLEVRYGDWVNSDIASAAFVQLADSFMVEIRTWSGGDRIKIVDLSHYFEPADPIELNVAEFISWDDDSMIMLCAELLEEEAALAIAISLGYATREDYFDF